MKDEEKVIKMAIIAGASRALKYKRDNRYASDDEAIQQVAKETREIISKLDSEE